MIPVFKPSYNKNRILNELSEIFDSGWTGLGPKTRKFENEFARLMQSPYAVFLNSCTSALHLALSCLDLPRWSRVAVPDITFISTAAAVLYMEYELVLVPVDDRMQINLNYLERHRSEFDCVIPVHYSGACCDMDRLMRVCEGIPVVEDCAHATGSFWKGKPLGTFGEMGCFSFHAVKNLPIADGGMVVGKPEYEKKLRERSWLGISKSTYDRTGKTYNYDYAINDLGYKYHGNDIMAVIGSANLEILGEGNARRREIYLRYAEEFSDIIHRPLPETQSSHHLVSCSIDNRDRFIDFMGERGVAISVHYRPVSMHNFYATFATPEVRANSKAKFEKLATLPCFPSLAEEDLDHVITSTKEFLGIR